MDMHKHTTFKEVDDRLTPHSQSRPHSDLFRNRNSPPCALCTVLPTQHPQTYFKLTHHIHATDEGKNQKPKGKAFYIGLAFVELGSQKKEIGNTSVQNIIRVPGVTGNIIEKLRTPVLLNNSPIIRLSNIHEQCQD
ncbi:hypothetical protein NQ315_012387 [Exocentrus adspersus]|uniref:Uncharacterized protein n=1 Tax=Exocentrus adspersus TaxID=1586481 RepID=A0AAV8VNU8_9CUCU|nr:hypothetical protein NQ315_012387 [Exocentrus adspersus]